MPGTPPPDTTSDAAATPEEWAAGLALGSHTIVRRIGVGATAEVYEAEHTTLRARVAIKRLLPRFRARPEVSARFLREGRAAAAIRHPHVVRVFDVGSRDGAPYLVMEFLQGEDLERHLAARAPLGVSDAVDLLLPVLSALKAAHEAGVIHRDLKPANVMLARDRGDHVRPVVVDFGIARATEALTDGVVTADEALLGTPAYMAPEQCQGATRASTASDQYALGVIAYQCLAGRRPFVEPSLPRLLAAIERNEFPGLRSLRDEIPEALAAAVHRALSRDPSARHADVEAFAHALLPFASERGRALWESLESVPREPPRTRVSERSPFGRAWLPVAFGVTALAFGGVFLRTRATRTPPHAPAPRREVLAPRATEPALALTSQPPAIALTDASVVDAAASAHTAAHVPIVHRSGRLTAPSLPRNCVGPNGANLCL